jgi:hypothetical protein
MPTQLHGQMYRELEGVASIFYYALRNGVALTTSVHSTKLAAMTTSTSSHEMRNEMKRASQAAPWTGEKREHSPVDEHRSDLPCLLTSITGSTARNRWQMERVSWWKRQTGHDDPSGVEISTAERMSRSAFSWPQSVFRPMDSAKGLGRPKSVMATAGALKVLALRARRCAQESRQCARSARERGPAGGD